MDRLGLNAVFQGTSGIKSDAYIQGLGPLAEGSLSFIEGAPIEKLPGGRFFQAEYDKAGYKEPPEAYGALGFPPEARPRPDRGSRSGLQEDHGGSAQDRERRLIVGPVTLDDHGQNTVPLISKYVAEDGKRVTWEDSEYAGGKRKLAK